jgi:hypothetical protein
MELDLFLQGVDIRDTGIESNVFTSNVLKHLIEFNCEAVSFTIKTSFVILNKAIVEQNREGFYLFDVNIMSNVDMATDFESNLRFDLFLNNMAFSSNNKVVLTNSQYSSKKIRFYIDPANLPERIELKYKGILFGNQKRQEIANAPVLLSGEIMYREGVVFNRI